MSTNSADGIIKADHEVNDRLDAVFLTTLVRCMKLATMHHLDNRAILPSITQLVQAINPDLQRGNRVALQVVDDNVFFNRQIIRLAGDTYETAVALKEFFQRLGISELAFLGPVTEQEVKDFLSTFQRFIQSASPTGFAAQRFSRVAVRPATSANRTLADLRRSDPRKFLLRSYAGVLVAFRNAAQMLMQGKPVHLDRLRRALQIVMDAAVDQEGLLLGLARMDNVPPDPSSHAVAVATYVMLMGKRLELPRAPLMDLCLAAMFHDVGRFNLANMQLSEARPEEYRAALARVPLLSLLALTQGTVTDDAVTRMAVAYEHTLPADGQPIGLMPEMPARMVAVPCAFDLMTRPAPPRRGLLPDQTLRAILGRAGRRFDPLVVRLFVMMVGRYPPGSLVRLAGGQYGIVLEPPRNAQALDKPVVKLFRDASGRDTMTVDLADGRSNLRIACAVDPRDYNINVVHHMLA